MFTNVGSKGVDGKLVFFSKTSGNVIAAFDPASDSLELGASFKLNGATITTAEAQPDSTATDVAGIVSDFNNLLAKLRATGLLEPLNTAEPQEPQEPQEPTTLSLEEFTELKADEQKALLETLEIEADDGNEDKRVALYSAFLEAQAAGDGQ